MFVSLCSEHDTVDLQRRVSALTHTHIRSVSLGVCVCVMRAAAAALLSLSFWFHSLVPAAQTGVKCGVPQGRGPTDPSVRVVGGSEATYGSHPWLVSLRLRGSHFCGGSILTGRWILTAAHCFSSVSRFWPHSPAPSRPPACSDTNKLNLLREFLGGVSVAAGEFDRRVDDEEEQVFGVKSVTVHEKYHHALPMGHDIALVELDQHIRLGIRVQPICLPLPDEKTLPRTRCIVGGWGRIKERGRLPAVLREIQLDLVDPAKCKYVLQTLRGPARPQSAMTVLCAGAERGGRDACQGDSGGPLVCPAGSGGGHRVVLGVTSWGKGCGRSWGNNSIRPPSRRGSPGVFTDVRLLLPWIKRKLRQADEQQRRKTSSGLCSVSDGPVNDSEGVIRNPALPGDRYDNNELCVWSITAQPGHSVLLELEHLDLENESNCRYDRLSVSAGIHRPVGIFCGRVPQSPLLLSLSQNATLLFSSDVSRTGSGFIIRHRAVQGRPDPGCGTIVLIEDETVVQSPNYPQSYSNDCVLRWVVYAPRGHVVKVEFTDVELEESDRCLYDSLTVLADVEQTEELAVLCGRSVPPPVLSFHNVVVLQFSSDSSITHRGFRATLSFISRSVFVRY
ncbi:ovochymase-2 isoform X3 [Paralichthys olivaceus]|uniref:ovochymase-2 isoform X3 n=1 Tax=Paralichthys olivaceus TaxID=8255 RepID=UPI003750FB73